VLGWHGYLIQPDVNKRWMTKDSKGSEPFERVGLGHRERSDGHRLPTLPPPSVFATQPLN